VTADATRRPLRICMVHYSDFHLDSRIQRQARALAERGDEVDLICLSEAGQVPVGRGTIRIHPVRQRKASGGPGAYLRGYGHFLAGALRRVSALSLRRVFDVVEVHNMPDALTFTALLPKLQGTAIVLNVHDTFPELYASKFGCEEDSLLVRSLRLEERLSATLADRVITVTEEARLRLEARGVGVGKGLVVMNSPDESVFGHPRPAAAPPADGGPIRVLYHGGLAPRFGVETIIRAFAQLGEESARLELRVCGSGDERDALAALAAELAPGRIEIAREPVPFADIPRELERAHLGVVPTLLDGLTELLLPVKLLEYVHMGLPVISSRLPVISRYFTDDDVRFFPAGDATALAAALTAACRDPEGSRALAESAGRRLQAIAWTSQRERYLSMIDQLAGRERTSASSWLPRTLPAEEPARS
jgi:glycosyltransferase involved in cell wall biosynthesis